MKVTTLPNISKIDGCPILDVNDTSLIGTWCDYVPWDIGTLATDEFTFAPDKTFVWRHLQIANDRSIRMTRAEGNWQLQDHILELTIKTRDNPKELPTQCIHFSVRMRDSNGRRQLVMASTVFDDDLEGEKYSLSIFPFEASPDEADINHAEYEAKRKKTITLDGPFKELVPLLSKAVPAAVRSLQIPDPLFCIRLFFHDTHAPAEDYCCWVRCLTDTARQRVLKSARPIDIPDELWHPTMGIANERPSPDLGVYEADLTPNAELMDLYARVYAMISESEEENMLKLRVALRRVSLNLHTIEWSQRVTDDFVVFPADGSNYFGGDYEQDMKASIPSQRLKLLAKRGYIAT
jgi:hypothetical protein